MPSNPNHTIHQHRHHFGWDNANEPALRVAPGETVAFETVDASGGQLSRTSTVADVAALDFAKVNPVTGPVYVEGAEPGDALKVTLEGFVPSGWGWTANIPGFGLLADDFPEPALHLWKYDPATMAPALYGPGGKVPLKPFTGTILYLPVAVPGALFSVGDCHAAQGDGEVCGTAIESPMVVTLAFDLVKGANLKGPRLTTPGPVSRHFDVKGYEVTTGINPDLFQGAKDAVRAMIDLLSGRHGMAPVEAYMLCSVCADLHISEIVDQPNWLVSCYFPRVVLD